MLGTLCPSPASATWLPDGTRLRVRLIQVISSETSAVGESLDFVVSRDAAINGEVLIARRTHAAGKIVDVARAAFGFLDHPGRLAFDFDRTTARDGQVIRLRASATPQPGSRVVVDRGGRHHLMQWANGADVFDAFVDGNYEILARP
jgi:hypothetical protein